MNRLYNTYTVLYHSYLQCTSLSGHVPGSSLKSKWIRETEYVLSPHRTEVFYKETAFHNFYSIPSYIQRKKSSWIFFPNSLSTVFERKFLSVFFFIFKIFLRIWQRVTMSSLSRIFNIFRDVSLSWFVYKVCNFCTFLSPSGDLGIGLVWDNHPDRTTPPQLFGPTVEILFKVN